MLKYKVFNEWYCLIHDFLMTRSSQTRRGSIQDAEPFVNHQ